MNFKNGDPVLVNDAEVYPTYYSDVPSITKSGKFFIYEKSVRNDRIRITDAKSKVNQPRMSTGWVCIADVIPANK